jgi:hypothetical protein
MGEDGMSSSDGVSHAELLGEQVRTSPLLSMPTELVFAVLGTLSSLDDLVSCAQVCSELEAVVFSLVAREAFWLALFHASSRKVRYRLDAPCQTCWRHRVLRPAMGSGSLLLVSRRVRCFLHSRPRLLLPSSLSSGLFVVGAPELDMAPDCQRQEHKRGGGAYLSWRRQPFSCERCCTVRDRLVKLTFFVPAVGGCSCYFVAKQQRSYWECFSSFGLDFCLCVFPCSHLLDSRDVGTRVRLQAVVAVEERSGSSGVVEQP